MWRVLVDHARSERRQKCDGGTPVPLDEESAWTDERPAEMMNTSKASVDRDLKFARGWLQHRLQLLHDWGIFPRNGANRLMASMKMDSQNWERLQELFHLAAATPSERRELVLAEACEDPRLRRQVLELVDAANIDEEPESVPQATELNSRIGPYHLVRHLGTGGIGSVYLAERAVGDPSTLCDQSEIYEALAWVMDKNGDSAGGAPIFKRAYDDALKCSGPDSERTLDSREFYASSLIKRGHAQEALTILQNDMPQWRKIEGDTPAFAEPLYFLSTAEIDTGHFTDGERDAAEVLRVQAGTVAPTDRRFGAGNFLLARALAGQQRYQEALPPAKIADDLLNRNAVSVGGKKAGARDRLHVIPLRARCGSRSEQENGRRAFRRRRCNEFVGDSDESTRRQCISPRARRAA